jgi:hypothetical protein
MDFLLGGLSGTCAGFFANVFDVSYNGTNENKYIIQLL